MISLFEIGNEQAAQLSEVLSGMGNTAIDINLVRLNWNVIYRMSSNWAMSVIAQLGDDSSSRSIDVAPQLTAHEFMLLLRAISMSHFSGRAIVRGRPQSRVWFKTSDTKPIRDPR